MKIRGSRGTVLDDTSPEDIEHLLHVSAAIMDIRTLETYGQGCWQVSLGIHIPRAIRIMASIPKDKQPVTRNTEDAPSTTAAGGGVVKGAKAVEGRRWADGTRLQGHR